MRDEAAEIRQESGINAMVTGTTAINIDTSDKLTAALPVFLVLVVGLALLLLAAVFRSIAVPVTAAAGFLLRSGTGRFGTGGSSLVSGSRCSSRWS